LTVPEGFRVSENVGTIGDMISGPGAGYVFPNITTPSALGIYEIKIKVTSSEISHTFKLQIILREGDS